MKPKSHTLFHFTKSLDVLKSILKNGFWPRYCLEDVHWVGAPEFDYVSYPMVCFCDIPLSRIEEHVGFYGRFGVGMSRQWAVQNGLNPVLYLAGSNNLANELVNLNDHFNSLAGEGQKAAKTTMRYIFASTKPAIGRMVVHGEPVQKDFYQESEWRYVPKHADITAYLVRQNYEMELKLSEANEKTKEHCLLKFSAGDIRYIFVEKDADIPPIMNFIQSELDGYTGIEIKILMSRVLSLESLHADL